MSFPSELHEFVSADSPTLFVAVREADPALIPAAAGVCCRQWVYGRPFRPGDGSHSREMADSLVTQIATVGYLIYHRPDPSESQRLHPPRRPGRLIGR